MRISSRSVSSCRARRRARSAFPWAFCAAMAFSGGLAAWLAFTMPSAVIMFAFALGAAHFTGPGRRRLSARAEACRGRRGGASRLGHGAKPDAGSHRAPPSRSPRLRSSSSSPDRSRRLRRSRSARSPGLWLCRAGAAPMSGRSEFSGHPLERASSRLLVRGAPLAPPFVAAPSARRHSRCSTRSTVPARWCSAAAMSCCRCCRPRS